MTEYKWLSSEPTDGMLNAIFSKYGKTIDKTVFITIWETMWKSASEVKHEPVAYRNFNTGDGGYESPYIYIDADDLEGYSEQYIRDAEPLYTQPQPKPKHEPLSYEKVLELKKKCTNGGGSVVDYFMFATELEKAHGIGVE
jgi:hypothetical protein